ncbi:hypothetical protein B7P43_G09109 [Cryptotermes secundus]|uniref:Uncharacterized protein n=1 Tax=Cryptotermes secundus TaxID=105785 RepID=A0A2J7RAI1_9NEOP|nr:uncharacterized protein LOC111862355 isoform X2 [Cryptotermes secundus]PNF37839.1 hypothetical protein B7P43_G09109 [Cryptotermes secundus]
MSSEKRKMLTEEDFHASPCPQSVDHVSTTQNWDPLTWMDDEGLAYLKSLGYPSILGDSPDVADGADDDIYRPVPAFKEASVSTEIGCHSDELFFSTTVEETENHQSSSNEIRQLEAEKPNLERTYVKTAVGRSKSYKRPLEEMSLHDIEQENEIMRRKICRLAAQLVDTQLEISRVRSQLSSDLEPESIADLDILKAAQLQAER